MYVFPGHPLISNLICIGIWIIILLVDDWRLWELEQEDSHKEKVKEKVAEKRKK